MGFLLRSYHKPSINWKVKPVLSQETGGGKIERYKQPFSGA
jgi:hypothetical protein